MIEYLKSLNLYSNNTFLIISATVIAILAYFTAKLMKESFDNKLNTRMCKINICLTFLSFGILLIENNNFTGGLCFYWFLIFSMQALILFTVLDTATFDTYSVNYSSFDEFNRHIESVLYEQSYKKILDEPYTQIYEKTGSYVHLFINLYIENIDENKKELIKETMQFYLEKARDENRDLLFVPLSVNITTIINTNKKTPEFYGSLYYRIDGRGGQTFTYGIDYNNKELLIKNDKSFNTPNQEREFKKLLKLLKITSLPKSSITDNDNIN